MGQIVFLISSAGKYRKLTVPQRKPNKNKTRNKNQELTAAAACDGLLDSDDSPPVADGVTSSTESSPGVNRMATMGCCPLAQPPPAADNPAICKKNT